MKTLLRILASLLVVVIAILAVFYLVSDGPSAIVSHVRINKPPQVVFNYISDMRNELKWNPDVQFMEKTTAGPIGVGTHFRAKWHLSDTVDEEIRKFDPPSELVIENGGALAVSLQVHLTGVDSVTEMEAQFIATPHGFLRAIFPIMRSQLKKQEAENMVNLKRAIEKEQ